MKNSVLKVIKIVAIVLACIILALVLTVGGYVGYVALQYYRIGDIDLDVYGIEDKKVELNTEYSMTSYNLGFGAYSPDYSFFMDEGVMKTGEKVTGKYAKGKSKADVQKNVDGQISVAKELNSDFYFFQEVDEKSDRSYKINMVSEITSSLSGVYTYAKNFHTANLLYPFNDPIGQSLSGIVTISNYQISASERREFPISTNFIDKLFDLDRCFSLNYLPIEGSDNYLVLLNLHMSAYDEGGKIRAKQLELLNSVLKSERDKGNYVVAGGDFNHCLIADQFASDEEALNHFESEQYVPDWVKGSILHGSDLTEGFEIVARIDDVDVATCRGADIPYTKGVNYSTVIDGFIVSDNVKVVYEGTVDTQYAYSDHNPVNIRFILE
jgi:endonuclease/exonuclease/phosphatase family metal-dependent hydrolase